MTYEIRTYNQIAEVGLQEFSPEYTIGSVDKIFTPDAIILRSHKLAPYQVPDSVVGVARAGTGVNNIPLSELTERGIVVFNTPGANAEAVKELVFGGMLMVARNLRGAVDYVGGIPVGDEDFAKTVEEGKKQYSGTELNGKTLGVVGLGAIGVRVGNTANTGFGMRVIGYDPAMSVDNAHSLSSDVERATDLEDLLGRSDYVSLHTPLNPATEGLMGPKKLASMKPGAVLLNFARGELVDEGIILEMLSSGKVASYVTDFPTPALVGVPNVIALPHLGASTVEAEENCAVMAVKQIKNFLEKGTVINSVNFPEIAMSPRGSARLVIAHLNKTAMISSLSTAIADGGHNIGGMDNDHRGNVAISLIDVSDPIVSSDVLQRISAVDGVLKARYVNLS